MIGILAGAAQALGFSTNLWGFIAAHGMIELSVIFICGGAGMQLGWSLVRPGLLTRRTRAGAGDAPGGLPVAWLHPLLVIAGTIEGFISPSELAAEHQAAGLARLGPAALWLPAALRPRTHL